MYSKNKDNNGTIERYQATHLDNSGSSTDTSKIGMYVGVTISLLLVAGAAWYLYNKKKSQSPTQNFGFKFY